MFLAYKSFLFFVKKKEGDTKYSLISIILSYIIQKYMQILKQKLLNFNSVKPANFSNLFNIFILRKIISCNYFF